MTNHNHPNKEEHDMTNDDDFMGGGGDSLPAFRFANIGDQVRGQICAVTKLDDRRPDGTPVTWDDGSPKHVWVFNLDTNLDGTADTAIWVRGNLVKVLREALKDAGLTPAQRPIITVKHHELGEARKGYAAPKLYKAKAEPAPEQTTSIDDF